jgi:hypothetical protein
VAPQEAVDAPRLHYQAQPDEVHFEHSGLSPEVIKSLTETGYRLVEQRPWGAVELIRIDGGCLLGVSDGRRSAGASGRILNPNLPKLTLPTRARRKTPGNRAFSLEVLQSGRG